MASAPGAADAVRSSIMTASIGCCAAGVALD
jgi:hypothetical protein